MPKLSLFFTRNVSVRQWKESGLLDRELRLYEKYIRAGWQVVFITYDSDRDFLGSLEVSGVQVFGKPYFLPGIVYSLIAPLLHRRALQNSAVFKTNQMDGAWTALLASLIFSGAFYCRTGYTITLFEKSCLKRFMFQVIERLMYTTCDISSVSSRGDRDYINGKYKLRKPPLVLNNYIDTDKFRKTCSWSGRVNDRILFVGRLNEQKNLFVLLFAAKSSGIGVDIVGAGEMREALAVYAIEHDVDVRFLGRVSNDLLPEIYNRYRYFALVSMFEGMPKSLLEALSCGCIPICSPVAGNKEVMAQLRVGINTAGTSVEAVKLAIERRHGSEESSDACCRLIEEEYSLSTYFQREATALEGIQGGQ